MTIKLGELKIVPNKQRKFGSNGNYYTVWIKRGVIAVPYAFTEEEINNAHNRALANKEDMPKLKNAWFQRFLYWF